MHKLSGTKITQALWLYACLVLLQWLGLLETMPCLARPAQMFATRYEIMPELQGSGFSLGETMGLFDIFKKKSVDLDQLVLTQLAKAGSDLSKPHEIDFFFYFPSENAAGDLLQRLRAEDFTVRSAPSPDGQLWSLEAQKTMMPELSALQAIRSELGGLARRTGGDYDGWGAAVV